MDLTYFETLISTLTGRKIKVYILENQQAKKWWDKKYIETNSIEEDTIYGISIDNSIAFDFKTGKIDSFLKTFVTQYISKYAITCYVLINGEMVKPTKEQAFNNLKLSNSERLGAYLFYSTNYGIGFWQIFTSNNAKEKATNILFNLLKTKNIIWTNEDSEAGWVYRTKFAGSYLDHNEVIKELQQIEFN